MIGRSFYTFLDIDTCNYILTIGIERYVFNLSLVNYEYGTWEHFWLQKIIRVE